MAAAAHKNAILNLKGKQVKFKFQLHCLNKTATRKFKHDRERQGMQGMAGAGDEKWDNETSETRIGKSQLVPTRP